MKWLLIVLCLPLLAYPVLLARCPEGGETETLVWCYPIYVLGAVWCAWRCLPERKTVYWILVALLALTHVAIWLLVDPSLI